MTATLRELTESSYAGEFAMQISVDSTRLLSLAAQLSAIDAVREHLDEILTEYRRQNFDLVAAELASFEKDNLALLRRYGAVK